MLHGFLADRMGAHSSNLQPNLNVFKRFHQRRSVSDLAPISFYEGIPQRFFHPPFDYEQRIVAADAEGVCFASIYVPNGGRDFPAKMRFLEAMDAYVTEAIAEGKQLIWCGDLNVARSEIDVHPVLRKPQEMGQTQPERALIERILSHGLIDLARQFFPDDDRLFTWWAPWRNFKQRNFGWRLDYVLATQGLAQRAPYCRTDKEFGTSDHAPVTVEFTEKS